MTSNHHGWAGESRECVQRHLRCCHACRNVAIHEEAYGAAIVCRRCGSHDTRLVVFQQPTPVDAIYIVCERHNKGARDGIATPVRVACRFCNVGLLVDARSIAVAASVEERQGRPIDFACCDCWSRFRPPCGHLVHVYDLRPSAVGGAA